ncbi:WG repeat-containing protein [Flavobacterium sp. H122]|uniref:WG repeat-containing protein n=1 Tax=Flavobacterium sp. H122 TaxID=2529860 RepID=UPI00145AD37B|nr:WG repeat-containing protein [Flavobacterium sp. H122]
MAKKNGDFGFIDTEGNWKIAPQFSKLKRFSEGLAPAKKGGGWGYIDASGKWIIEPQFEDAECFNAEGLAPVRKMMWGYIDRTGKNVIACKFEISPEFGNVSSKDKNFKNGLARVKYTNKWGFLKKDGTVLSAKWYDNAELFSK